MEHHSNVVPWYLLARQIGAELEWVPVDGDGQARPRRARRRPSTADRSCVAVAHVSNVLGTINPIAEITRMAHDAGALVVVDGAQAAPKLELDLAELGADFYAFTGHKLLRADGRRRAVRPGRAAGRDGAVQGGGSMIRKVTKERITWASVPARFEAGTPPIARGHRLGGRRRMAGRTRNATPRTPTRPSWAATRSSDWPTYPACGCSGRRPGEDRVGIVSFALDGVHPHDIVRDPATATRSQSEPATTAPSS